MTAPGYFVDFVLSVDSSRSGVVRLIIHDDFSRGAFSGDPQSSFDLEHKADNEMRLIDLFSREEFTHLLLLSSFHR